MVVSQFAAVENAIDQGEPRRGPVTHRDRRRPIEPDERRRIGTRQHVVVQTKQLQLLLNLQLSLFLLLSKTISLPPSAVPARSRGQDAPSVQ